MNDASSGIRSSELYDWFKDFSHFEEFVSANLKKSDKILMLGCGNSKLSEDMCLKGYKNITNVDYAENVINFMKERNLDKPEMKWITMNIKDMSDFSNGEFDAGDVWDPPEELKVEVGKYLKEVSRVLKANSGKFLYITFGQAVSLKFSLQLTEVQHFRKIFLDKSEYNWKIETNTFGDAFHYFVYLMLKNCSS
ncbi:hypothetical protein HK099_007733 [Clydaea vesicula]|uniref:Methyltransferase domain-containing protein n=1 Tax=Clydaea vesicula TaxID=447962 RepID=A0AAD5U5B4_9FUNG|nr:hypothetical protein HK099_007733 [Clydaea vesicula]